MNGEPPFTLGIEITRLDPISDTSVLVTFDSAYEDAYLYQAYFGRSLAGVTESPNARQVLCGFIPSDYPEHIQILAVSPAQRNNDYGSDLPDRPYNRVKISGSTVGFDADTRSIEVSAGTEPEGAVDETNIVAREVFQREGDFEVITDPLGPGGEWNFEVAGRDGTLPEGNRGEPLELSAVITAHPPDLVPDDEGKRFTVAAVAGTLELSYELPEF